MFNAIYEQKLRHAEFLQLMRFIEKLIFKSGINSLVPLHAEFKTVIDMLEIKMKSVTKNPLTAQIHEMDDKRDLVYLSIVKLIGIYANHSDSSISESAQKLMPVVEAHGKNAAYLSLNEETAVLSSFVTEIESTTVLVEAVSNVPGLQVWINDLKTYNKTCEDLLQERNLSNIPTQNTKEIRASVYDLYKTIKNHIMAHINLNSEGNYSVLKDEINEQIKGIA